MKKHPIFLYIMLLTIAPVKLLGMEENQNSKKISEAVEKLYNLTEFSILENPFENVLNKLSDFSDTTDDCTKLREGIIAITPLLTIWKDQNNPQTITLKKLRTSLYDRLALVLLLKVKSPTATNAKLAAKDFCYGVIDDISDDETDNEKNNYTQNNFNKYKDIINKILNAETEQNKLNQLLLVLQNTQSINILEINKLEGLLENIKKTNNKISTEIANNQEEIKVLKIAHEILKDKSLHQFEKMKKQKDWLIKNITDTNDSITCLQKEFATLTNKENIAEKNTEIKIAKIELAKLQNTLSYLDKSFAEVKKETGTFSNLLWSVGLYNYNNPNEERKKN